MAQGLEKPERLIPGAARAILAITSSEEGQAMKDTASLNSSFSTSMKSLHWAIAVLVLLMIYSGLTSAAKQRRCISASASSSSH